MTPLEEAFEPPFASLNIVAKLAEQMVAVFSDPDLSGEDFSIQPFPAIAIRGNDGDLEFYAYDEDDTTTADDGGLTTIVVPPGRRYKKRAEVILRDSALSATEDTQPVSPSLGDTYIIPPAPSGDDWASNAETVATFTARGWIFRQPFVGMVVYVEDDQSFYFYNQAGDWQQGLGPGSIGNGSILPEKLDDQFYVLKVEDERNAPPGSDPTVGTKYQVGTSPTGAFSGHDREVAIWRGSAYVFLTPAEGDTIYRRDQATLFTFRSGAWTRTVAAAGVQQVKRSVVAASFVNVVGTPQLASGAVNLTSQPGKYLRFTFNSLLVTANEGNAGGTRYDLGIYIDSSSAPAALIISRNYAAGTTTTNLIDQSIGESAIGYVAVPDGAAHNYAVGIARVAGTANSRDFVLSGQMFVEEMELVP